MNKAAKISAVLIPFMCSPAFSDNYSVDAEDLKNLSDTERMMHRFTAGAIEGNKITRKLCRTSFCRNQIDRSTREFERSQKERVLKNQQLENESQ